MNRRYSMPVRSVLAFVSVFVVAAVSCPSWAHADTLSDLYGCQYDRTSVFVGEDDSGDSYQSPESEMADEVDDGIATYSIPSVSPRDISGEMLYFCTGESGQNYDQGLSWGDGYNAMGFYQFDRGADLGRFLQAVYNYNPSTYSCLNVIGSKYNWVLSDKQAGPTRANGDFTQLGKDLNDAWHACYKANPAEFSQLQNGWAYDNYYVPAANYMRSRGIPIDDRSDSVKSLCWGMSNLFGTGGWRKFVGGWTDGYSWDGKYYSWKSWPGAGLTANMSDEEFITTLCDYVVDNVSVFYKAQPQYWDGWRNRYKAEKVHYLKIIEENAGVFARYAPSEFAALHASDLPDGTYRLAPAGRGGASLDVAGGSTANGAAAQVWSANGTDAQVWRVTHDSAGFVVLTSAKSGRVLDCADGSSARETRLQLWDANGTDAQRWVAARRSDGTLVLVSALSGTVGVDDAGDVVRGRVADLTGGATADGTRVQLWDANGTAAQSWSESAAQTERERLDALAAESSSVLRDGTYAIRPLGASRRVLDVSGGSSADGANVQLWSYDPYAAQQLWTVSHDSAGYVTLTSARSGKVLDLSNGRDSNGANVQQWSDASAASLPCWAQKWIAVPGPSGGVRLLSATSVGWSLDLSGGRDADGANLQLWQTSEIDNQSFEFVPADASVGPCERDESLEGRWWVLSSSSDGSRVLDVADGSLADGADVRGWSSNGTLAQAWALEWEDGWYRLVCAGSGSCLDVADGGVLPGTNVRQWSCAPTGNQLFSVSRNADGTVCLVNRATGLALGMSGSSLVGLSPDSSSAAQRFSLAEATADLAEGVYSVSPACGSGLSLDVADGSAADGANVRSWASNGSFAQRWYLGRAGDGEYYLECVGSAMRLAVSAEGNACQRRAADGDASQLWRVSVARGGYVLESVAYPGKVLDVSGGSSASGANVQAYASNGTVAQRFRLVADGGSLPSGTYVVRSAADASLALDVADGSLADGANVRAWESNDTGAQKWRVTRLSDGTYSVANCQSGRMLDVRDAQAAPGANVQQWASNGNAAQRWRAAYRPGGWALASALDPSLVLTLAGGPSRGSNAVVDRDSGSASQRFTFRQTTYIPSDRQEMVWKAQGYYSSTNWLVLIDNTNNKVGIFNGSRGNWNLAQFWTCTTGKASTPTVLGEYQVGSRGYSFGHGYTCYYWTQFYKDYLFHSVLYDEDTFRIQDGRLGQNLSHGCVRLDINNAKWIYNNIPSRTKVVSYR